NAAADPGFPPNAALALVDSSALDRRVSRAGSARAAGRRPLFAWTSFVRQHPRASLGFWIRASFVLDLFRVGVPDFPRFPRATNVALAAGLVVALLGVVYS